MNSILQDWVMQIGRRHQGVLLTIVRGFDGWKKHAPEKPLIREMRGLILVPFDPRELRFPNGFMSAFPHPSGINAFRAFCDNIDGLSLHYVMHIIHAAEILGYCYPNIMVQATYQSRYLALVEKLHLYPESKEQMDSRLNGDRVAARTVEG